ncbi:MAG: SCP2 sterol-binding domain-containing protein [Actinomycetota bacterium]|nr:SCP2 sterol-binding domain-containing protein [Actinomycetota bacterium]
MARYLSQEWFEEVNAAARREHERAPRPAGGELTLQQIVSGGPDGDVRYWVRVGHGALQAGLGEAADADATVSQSWETAVAVVKGDLDAQAALMAGRIRLSGNAASLVEHQEALRGLHAAFADVHRRTSYR